MACPDCGAENSSSHTTCHKCGVPLPTPGPSDGGKSTPRWKRRITLWGILFLLIVIPSLFMADLFYTPREVVLSRRSFDALRKSYYAKPATWGKRKEAMCSWIEQRHRGSEVNWEEGVVPLEVFMAYLVDRLELTPDELKDIALYPDLEQRHLILSKHEKGFTPIPIILSLEMELLMEEGNLIPHFISLKRGSREVPCALAWVYFGPELQLLGCLKPIAEEVKRIQTAESSSSSSLKR